MSSEKKSEAGQNYDRSGQDGDRIRKKEKSAEEKKIRRQKMLYLIISLALACLIWGFVMQKENPHIGRTFSSIKVEFVNEDALAEKDLAISDSEDPYISIRVTGRRSVLMKLDSSDIKVTADASRLAEGENEVAVSVSVPDNVVCDKITPSEIKITTEQVVTEQRKIQVVFEGDTEENSQPAALEQEYETIQITGLKSVVSKVDKIKAVVETGQVSDSLSESEAVLTPVDKTGSKVDHVQMSQNVMNVTTRMECRKEVSLTTSVTGEVAEGYQMLEMTVPDKVQIVIPYDEESDIESVTADPVDLSGLKKSKTVSLNLVLPEDCMLAEGQETPQAKIIVAEVTVRNFSIDTSRIEVLNLPEGRKLTFASDTVEIQLKGVVTELSAIRKKDIHVSVDALGISSSVTALPLSVEIDQKGTAEENIEAEETEVEVVVE